MKAQQPLTAKAKAAIVRYVELNKKKHGYISGLVIDFVLKAERMERAKLYAWLDGKGWKWSSKRGYWYEKVGKGKSGKPN